MTLNCREFADFILAYLEEDLPEGQRGEFERHIDDCPACVHYLRTYQETVQLGKCICDDEDAPPPGDAPEELVQAILAARRRSPGPGSDA